MASEKLLESLRSGAHFKLSALTGTWKGQNRTWFGEDLADESEISGVIKPFFDGRFLLHEYTTAFRKDAVAGLVILSYHLQTGQFQSATIDTFHTGTAIMFAEGPAAGPFGTVKSTYYDHETPPQAWGWRTEIEIPHPDKLVITAYNISPQGEQSRATEITYERVSGT